MNVGCGWLVETLLALLSTLAPLLPDSLAAPLAYGFMQRALITSVVVGTVAGVLSCYVVLKRWALLGDAISHAVLPGVAVAHLLGWPLFAGAYLTGSLTALGIGLLERNTGLKEDTAMGIAFTGAFAAGVVLISRMSTSTHLMHILFGNVLGVTPHSLCLTMAAGAVTLLAVLLWYKEFLLYSFDPIQAAALGLNTAVLHYGLMLLLTLTIVTSLETVGIILVVAMLITPGATAYLLTQNLARMMAWAAAQGATSAVVGLWLSFHYDLACGGTIVLVSTALFLTALLLSPRQGLWRRLWRGRASR